MEMDVSKLMEEQTLSGCQYVSEHVESLANTSINISHF